MKRTPTQPVPTLNLPHVLVVAILVGFLSGCGGSSPGSDPESRGRDTSGSDAEPQIVQRSESAATEKTGTPENVLRELTLTARKLESEHRFIDAANVWNDVVQRLEAQFGTNCWQAANAKLAYDTAMRQQEFTPPELATLDEITKLQNQVRAASEQQQTAAAIERAKRSIEKTIQLFGPDSAVTAKQRRLLGNLLLQNGNMEDAVFQMEKSLVDLSSYYAAPHPEICSLHDELGEIYLDRRQTAAAIQHLASATRTASELWGDDSTQYAQRANQLGVGYFRGGELETALNVLRAAEVIRRRALGTDSLEVAHSRLNIGTVSLELKQYEPAIDNLLSAYEIFRSRKFDQMQFQVAEKLAIAYMVDNQPALAEPLLQERLAVIAQQHASNDHPDVADGMYRLGIAMGRQGKFTEAEPYLEKALRINEAHFGPHHSRTTNCYAAYAMLLERTNRSQLAEQLNNKLRVAQQSTEDGRFIR